MATKKRKPGPGRNTVLTDETQAQYLIALRRGGNDKDCALYAGFDPSTVRRWRARYEIAGCQTDPNTQELTTYADDGAKPDIPRLHAFFTAIQKGTAQAKVLRLGQIESAAADPKYWTAAAWWLERKFPDEYGRRERRDVHVTLEEAEAVLDKHIEELEASLGESE